MNILPKKSWHVRTKKNIARVRKDEAKAAEEEKETQRRIALAAQEARTALLRERASKRLQEAAGSSDTVFEGDDEHEKLDESRDRQNGESNEDMRFGIPLGSLMDVVQPDGHVNFFQDVEAGKRQGGAVNEEHEEEKRKEQEDYEKKIGYLVYLGQDSLEHSRNKPWYAKVDRGKPEELEQEKVKEKDLDDAAARIGGLEEKSKTVSVEDIKKSKTKSFLDPLNDIRKYLSTPGVKRKLDSLPSSSKSSLRSLSPPSKKIRVTEDAPKKDKHKKHKHKTSKKSKKHKKHSKSKKHKKSSSKKSDSTDSGSSSGGESSEEERKRARLEKLRAERLQREREERRKAEQVLRKLRGESVDEPKPVERSDSVPSMSIVKQKYNSQFNPHLARQNYD